MMRRSSTDGSSASADPPTPVSHLRGQVQAELISASAAYDSLQARVSGLEQSNQAVRQELAAIGSTMLQLQQSLSTLVVNSTSKPSRDSSVPMPADDFEHLLTPSAPFAIPGVTMAVLDDILTSSSKPSIPLLHTPNSRFDRTGLLGGNAISARVLDMDHHPDFIRISNHDSLGKYACVEFKHGFSAASWLLDTFGALVAFREHVPAAHSRIFDEILRHFGEALSVLTQRLSFLQLIGSVGINAARSVQVLARNSDAVLDPRHAVLHASALSHVHKHATQEHFAAVLRGGGGSGPRSRGGGAPSALGSSGRSAQGGRRQGPSSSSSGPPRTQDAQPAPPRAPRTQGPSGAP